MTTDPAIEVLQRARLRIVAHGFDASPTPARQVRRPRGNFTGYSLSEAVYGLDPSRDATEGEIEAFAYLHLAVTQLYPEVAGDNNPVQAFNDTPFRRKGEVINVINRAINLAKAGVVLVKDITEPAPTSQTEAPVTSVMAVPTESAADINGIKETAELRAPQTFHPLDHDKDGHKGGSLPSSQSGFEVLWAEAEVLGIAVDHRWGLQTLLDAIAEAKAEKEPLPLPELGPKLIASDGLAGIGATTNPPLRTGPALTLVGGQDSAPFPHVPKGNAS